MGDRFIIDYSRYEERKDVAFRNALRTGDLLKRRKKNTELILCLYYGLIKVKILVVFVFCYFSAFTSASKVSTSLGYLSWFI